MVGFVLSGGASLGAVQVGMLRALYEREIAPELIVGTSAGAVNGAFIASRPPTVESAESLAEVWRGLNTLEVFPPNPVTALLGVVGLRDHLVPNSGVKALLKKYAQFRQVQEATIPLHLVTTDIETGAERLISRGDAEEAVLASAAIPGVYPAIHFEGEVLVDGGVANNTAISDAAELGASEIYVLPTGSTCRLSKPPRSAIQMLVHALTLLINQRLAQDIETFSHDAKLIVLPPPCPLEVMAWDFSHAEQLMEQGYEQAVKALENSDPSGYGNPLALRRLKPHRH